MPQFPEEVYGGERGFSSIESRPLSQTNRYSGPKNTIGWERFHVTVL